MSFGPDQKAAHSFVSWSNLTRTTMDRPGAAMSVSKLLARIVDSKVDNTENQVHDHTCGIKSDSLTQFSVVLSALIHDVDHSGVSNAEIISENPMLANLYGSRCVAEQNSVDVAWKALMSSAYSDLRAVIFTTEDELRRFGKSW
jgi:3'5'-cyclic nucleotide phosphodiesterase